MSTVQIILNGRTISAESGSTVAAALLTADETAFRATTISDVRAPLCGMGICYECRVTIDGVAHQRACMTLVQSGMHVVTASAHSR